MKVSELKALLDKMAALPGASRRSDNDVVVRLSDPSVGPVATCGITGGYTGGDWDNGKFILQPEERITRKNEAQEVYDATFDLVFSIYSESFEKQRKPWHFKRIERIYERLGILEKMQGYAAKDPLRGRK